MSDLRSLYTEIAKKTISYTNELGTAITVAGRDLTGVFEEIESLHCPTRIIVPFAEHSGGRGSELNLLTVGTSNVFGTMTWTIADLYLHAAIGEKTRIAYHLSDLVRYCAAYAEMIADSGRDMGLGSMTFQSLSLQCTNLEWPGESNQWFHGVEAILTYEELINP